MAVVVGEAVQYYDALVCSPQHQIFVVILRVLQIMADKAATALAQALNVLNSPRRP